MQNITSKKQLFLSHTWQKDVNSRNNHHRTGLLKKELSKIGWTVWYDQDDMGLNLDASMVNGIEQCEAFIVCVTKNYAEEINKSSFNLRSRSNCLKEFNYANSRNKIFIYVLFDKLHHIPVGILTMYMASTIYVDGSGDNLKATAEKITHLLESQNIKPVESQSKESKWKFCLQKLQQKRQQKIHKAWQSKKIKTIIYI